MIFGGYQVPGIQLKVSTGYQSVLCTLLLQCCRNATALDFDPRTTPVWRYDIAAIDMAAALLHDAPVGADCCCFFALIFNVFLSCVFIHLFSLCPEIEAIVAVNLNIGCLYL